jgi:hypothetical protein
MPRCCLLGVLVCGLLVALFSPAPAAAGDLLSWLKGAQPAHPPETVGTPRPTVAAGPGPQVYPEHHVSFPGRGSALVPSAYAWGSFGAGHRPVRFCHKGYYGDSSWYRYRRIY